MATYDISRHLLQQEKRYSSARMQKGRVLLDSDFNEGEGLDDEGQRVVVVDVVGRHGSSDRGFVVENVTGSSYDFTIAAGSYYLGGMRHEIADSGSPLAPQRYRKQTNWRQAGRAGEVPALLATAPVGVRHDLAYLVAWEQDVSAIEDGELPELALGGFDTSTRVRRMHRVYVAPGIGSACADSFDALVAGLTTGGHSYDTTSGELKSGARLAVSFELASEPGDLCSQPLAGYRGSENQAIRLQLIAPDRFLWAYDDASPLFRVVASVVANTVTVVFTTPPRQQSQFPLKGQVLEFLPWGASLANGEHVAAHPIAANIGGGVLARVTTSYNPRTMTLEANILDPSVLVNMLGWFGTEGIPVAQRFLYVRVWNPGDNGSPTEFGVAFGMLPVALGGTGLSVQMTPNGIIGDHWIIAARPATPGVVVPWDLSVAAAPHGPRRFYSPLAMIHWPAIATDPVKVDSCRRTFRPLTRVGGCYNVTVGDGGASHGDYTSIQEAILSLPPDKPGRVRILPGVYEELITIKGRRDVVVEGCGERTILRTPAGNSSSQAIFTLEACENFKLRNFKVEAVGQFGVGVRAGTDAAALPSLRIVLEGLHITTERDPSLDRPTVAQLGITAAATAFPVCTIAAIGVYDLTIADCRLTMVGDLSAAANVLLLACGRVVVKDCSIATPPGHGVASKAWGGLHIAGYCDDVLVERCDIVEGLGHGITLGSARPPAPVGALLTISTVSSNQVVMDPGDDCPGLGGGFPVRAADSDDPVLLVPDPGPHGVKIRNNRIRGMGTSGISVLGFFPEEFGDDIQQIQTHRLEISDNVLEHNYAHPAEAAPSPELLEVIAFGGVVLTDAEDLRIHDNRIHHNGVDHRHAVCGIYVLHGENVLIENNQIYANGPRVAGSGLSGHRAGIALQLVGRRILLEETRDTGGVSADAGGGIIVAGPSTHPSSGFPTRTIVSSVEPAGARLAARVRGNVVLQPAGRALQIYGIGPMFVEGNLLVSEGLDGVSSGERQYAAHCIEIQNIGHSNEVSDLDPRVPANLGIFPSPPLFYDLDGADLRLVDGRILFTDNQVRFNPVAGAGVDVFCATRIQSYGDVAVLGNQFFARLARDEGILLHDTIVTAWSTRTSHNRWEDPEYTIGRTGLIATTVSAQTLGFMNISTLNQASRCIHVDVAAGGDVVILNNGIARNQIWNDTDCDPEPGFAVLLGAPG